MTHVAAKPDLALIHGWGVGHAAWEPVLPALAQRFHVHLIALPGYEAPETRMDKRSPSGHCQKAHEQTILEHIACRTPIDAPSSDAANSMPAFVRTAEALAERLPADCFLAGWSLGAMLAMQMALLTPPRIKGLILIGSTPSFMQRDGWPDAQPPALLDTFCDAVSQEATGTLQRFMALLNQGDNQARTISRTMSKRVLETPQPDTATLLNGLGWLRDVDLRQRIAAINTPALLIHGEKDPLMPLHAAQWLNATLPNAQLEVFAGAAHAPFLNDPERFATLIGDFCHALQRH